MTGIVPAAIFAALVGTLTILLARFTTARGALQQASEVTPEQKSTRRFALFVAVIATFTGSVTVFFLFPQKQAGAVALGVLCVILIGLSGVLIHFGMAKPRTYD